MLSREKLDNGYLLLLYDVKVSKNVKRNWMRNKIKKMRGGYALNQSCYIVPKSYATEQEIEDWGKDNDVDIKVFGLEVSETKIKTLTDSYVKELEERFKNVKKFGDKIWDDIIKAEENIDDPELKLTGYWKKIDGVRHQFEDMQKIINKIGDEEAQRELERQDAFIEKLRHRLQKLKDMKIQIASQGRGLPEL